MLRKQNIRAFKVELLQGQISTRTSQVSQRVLEIGLHLRDSSLERSRINLSHHLPGLHD